MPANNLKILFIGDINGKLGRLACKKILPGLKKEAAPDLVIANADNLAHGKGATGSTIRELMDYGVDYFTTGDHAFDKTGSIKEVYGSDLPIIRPLNYSCSAPGKGYALIKTKKGDVLLANLIGRVFMKMDHECPFTLAKKILKKFDKKNLSAIIIDMHAEATSEKLAFKHYLDGQASAILGTHTHVMTADSSISKAGTAYITDTGMVGASSGVIGVAKENVISTFLTQVKHPYILPERGEAIFNAVAVEIDPGNRQAKKIKTITKFTTLN